MFTKIYGMSRPQGLKTLCFYHLQTHSGVKGHVTDAATDEPINRAVISVTPVGKDAIRHDITTTGMLGIECSPVYDMVNFPPNYHNRLIA